MSVYYYKLSEEDKWLGEGSNPYEIGGRSTDIGQIGRSLYMRLREAYPINEAPSKLIDDVNALIGYLDEGEIMIQTFIDEVTLDLDPYLADEKDKTD